MLSLSYVEESRLCIDEVTAADASALSELFSFGSGDFGYPIDATAGVGYDSAAYIAQLIAHPQQSLACRYEDWLVGILCFGWLNAARTALVIRNVFVHPAFRDGSVLFALFEALHEDDDDEAGCGMLLSATDPTNRAAISASRKFGFSYLPGREYSLVSHLPMLLRHPVLVDFFERCRISPAEYFLHLRRSSAASLGPTGDQEIWNGRPVCRYRFESGGDSLEMIVDLGSDDVTAVSTATFFFGLRSASECFDTDGILSFLDIENRCSKPLNCTIAWCDSAAPNSSLGRVLSLPAGQKICLPLAASATAAPGRHRSAVIVTEGGLTFPLMASYRLLAAVHTTSVCRRNGSSVVRVQNCLPEALGVNVCRNGQPGTALHLDTRQIVEVDVLPGELTQFRLAGRTCNGYESKAPVSSGVWESMETSAEGMALRAPGTEFTYDARSKCWALSNPEGTAEYVRRRWIELGPPYWSYDGGTSWIFGPDRIEPERGEFTMDRQSPDNSIRVSETVNLLAENSFEIRYCLSGGDGHGFATLLELLLPHPLVSYELDDTICQFTPVLREFPHRLSPVRPSGSWLTVTDGRRELRLEWQGGQASLFAEIESLKLMLEFPGGRGRILLTLRDLGKQQNLDMETAVARLAGTRPAASNLPTEIEVQPNEQAVALSSSFLSALVANDPRAPIVQLRFADAEFLSSSYPRFGIQGRDPESCGGLGLRVSAAHDLPCAVEWVRDFNHAQTETRRAPHMGIFTAGSLSSIGHNEVAVVRRILMRPDFPALWVETSFRNDGLERAVFAAREVLTPASASEPGFRVYTCTGMERSSRTRTNHECVALSRGALICGRPGVWLAFVCPEVEAAANEQGRFGFQLEARARITLLPGACHTLSLLLIPGRRKRDVLAAVQVLLDDNRWM